MNDILAKQDLTITITLNEFTNLIEREADYLSQILELKKRLTEKEAECQKLTDLYNNLAIRG